MLNSFRNFWDYFKTGHAFLLFPLVIAILRFKIWSRHIMTTADLTASNQTEAIHFLSLIIFRQMTITSFSSSSSFTEQCFSFLHKDNPGAPSRFWHLETYNLNFSSLSFVKFSPSLAILVSWWSLGFIFYTINPFSAKDVLIDFTLSNARRFYSSKGNPLALKGLNY